MPHETALIGTVAAGLGLAFVFGYLAARLRLPPLVGYLLAGVAVGPLIRALEEKSLLDSADGRIAVGWLIVEDPRTSGSASWRSRWHATR